MPRIGITAYDLLISCPSDVEKYVKVAKECIAAFNSSIGIVNNAEVCEKYWATDCYAQSGDKPQELLNQQIVRNCDAAVAIFWTQFGTSTDKYGSGTEEEIEEMLSAKKQVFMYFVEEPVSPSCIVAEQYNKIQQFKDKYKDRGIYFIVKDNEELRRLFTNHLTKHFLPIITGDKTFMLQDCKKPLLSLRCINQLNQNEVEVLGSSYLTSNFITNMERDILADIRIAKNVVLGKRETRNKEVFPNKQDGIYTYMSSIESVLDKGLFSPNLMSDADIPETWKSDIIGFCKEVGEDIDTDFWNVGNLTFCKSLINPMFGGNSFLEGKEDEKKHYEEIENIYWKIIELYEYRQYFSILDSYKRLKLIVLNTGNTFDEDIDIKIFIPKNKIVNPNKLPIPGINIIDDILEKDFLKLAFQISATDEINTFSDYPSKPLHFNRVSNPVSILSSEEKYDLSKEEYSDEIENLFCYKFFEKADSDVLALHINYLKHNTKMAFPSMLVFSDVPDYIDYEITSRHSPDVKKGKIELFSTPKRD